MDRIASPKVAGYLFVAPFVIYFLIFFLYPICETFYTSLRQQVGFAPPKFAGLANYKLLKNEYFFTAVVLVVFCCWKWMGVNIVYYLSALQSIPKELYEAAEIDGANAIQRFFKVTVPSVKLTPYGNNYDMLLSGAVMSVLPIMIIFMLNQKAFIAGLTAGSVKG